MTGEAFAVPAQIETDLVRVRAYWRGLIRGYADMPDWDDFNRAPFTNCKRLIC